ncbi:MAG: hypothetical protein Q8L35_06365 [Actinomycetota bacterium]|nr:hypothetical protein [Actinomycetota bacterium]
MTEAELKRMVGFTPDGTFVVSLYLNVDGAKHPRLQDYEKELRGLLHQAEREWIHGDKGVDKAKRRSLKQDLDKIGAFVTGNWRRDGQKGLAVFSCAAAGFWHVFELPVGVPSALIVGDEPYAKTLTAVLDEYKRYCVVSVDRRKARYFTVYLGEIEEHHGVFVDERVPDQVKEGEWASLRQSRIARHIEDHVLHHLKDVAGLTFNFFLEHSFDRLILAGRSELIPKFRAVLHPYLQMRVAGEFQAGPDAPLPEILKESLRVEEDIQRREEEALLHRLEEEAHPGGLGVTGLRPTVDALMRGQAHILLIKAGYATQGYVCYRDHFLATADGVCPVCGGKLSEAPDIVEDMVQLAINQNVQVEHISHVAERLAQDKVGALLRFGL